MKKHKISLYTQIALSISKINHSYTFNNFIHTITHTHLSNQNSADPSSSFFFFILHLPSSFFQVQVQITFYFLESSKPLNYTLKQQTLISTLLFPTPSYIYIWSINIIFNFIMYAFSRRRIETNYNSIWNMQTLIFIFHLPSLIFKSIACNLEYLGLKNKNVHSEEQIYKRWWWTKENVLTIVIML